MTTPPTSRPATSAGPHPTNDDIEAVIQMAMSAHAGSAHIPPRDTRTQLFVGNLPYRVRWQDLKDLFRRAGTVLRADVSLAPDNRSRGYGTVLLATAEDAGRAVDMFNGFVWQTRTLEVRLDRMAAEDTQLLPQGLSGGVGLGGAGSANASASGTPFGPPKMSRIVPSPSLFPADDRYLKTASPIAGLASPAALSAQLTGTHTPLHPQFTGSGAERSRNLFVGNLPFHIQWQDLKDLFRQAGTILRADVALGPDGRSRGFGTVSFATETDGERAVRMFNGYEFNGRQLKVHFDKFSASSATALPLTGLSVNSTLVPGISLSAPQSPHAGSSYASLRPAPLSHAASFAQQILVQQHEQAKSQLGFGTGSEFYPSSAFSLHRANTDSIAQTFRFHLPGDESHTTSDATHQATASAVPKSLLDPTGSLTRARTDSRSENLHPSPRTQSSHSSQPYQSAEPHHPTHISLPPPQPLYSYDFSPGSPYDVYHLTMASNGHVQPNTWQVPPENQQAYAPAPQTSLPNPLPRADSESMERPSTSPAPAPANSHHSARSHNFVQHAHSQSESFLKTTASAPVTSPSSAQNSQPHTQVTSPVLTSPTPSAHSSSVPSSANSGSSTATHPAHPGPIALPPPPSVTAFPIPPPHTLSPVYHPQMSPYVSPLHHPAVMMGMMGVNMTPHGLPPITPSMPSFTFLPQPSPTTQPAAHDRVGDHVSPSNGQNSSPANGSVDPQQQQQHPAGAYFPHLHHAHGPMLSPYTPFSPGVAMSPGSFWGRPGNAGVNQYINPAVGAPVHAHSGYFPPVPPRQPEEPQGYFPPFMPASASSASKPSGLANEIDLDSTSANGSAGDAGVDHANDIRPESSHSLGTTTGTPTTTTDAQLPSSNGTSWHTDSLDPSPVRDLTQGMDKLSVDATSLSLDLKPRASSAGAQDNGEHVSLPQVLPRADSDPTQAKSPNPTASASSYFGLHAGDERLASEPVSS